MHGASCAEFMAMIFTVSEIALCCCCLFQDFIFSLLYSLRKLTSY